MAQEGPTVKLAEEEVAPFAGKALLSPHGKWGLVPWRLFHQASWSPPTD